MKELQKILEELGVKSATSTYGEFKPAGEVLKLKEASTTLKISPAALGGSIDLTSTIGQVIAEKIEVYPNQIIFLIFENGNDETYFANLKTKEILLFDYYTDKGIQRVKDAINNYYAQNPKSDNEKSWTFKEEFFELE